MVKTVITDTDLSEEDFSTASGKVKVKIQRSQYEAVWADRVQGGENTPKREDKLITIQHGLGVVSLDFRRQSGQSGDVIARLPDSCPTPATLIQSQTDTGGVIYIEANSREIKKSTNLLLGRRYVVNLIGFFN